MAQSLQLSAKQIREQFRKLNETTPLITDIMRDDCPRDSSTIGSQELSDDQIANAFRDINKGTEATMLRHMIIVENIPEPTRRTTTELSRLRRAQNMVIRERVGASR